MSAFMVGKPHITALVALALYGPRDGVRWSPLSWYSEPVDSSTTLERARALYRVVSPETADQIGQMLLDANAASITARYGADAPELDEPYVRHYRVRALPLVTRPTALEGLKVCACFRYQACEDAGWERSEAARFIDNLEHALISHLPGYDNAAGWEWRG